MSLLNKILGQNSNKNNDRPARIIIPNGIPLKHIDKMLKDNLCNHSDELIDRIREFINATRAQKLDAAEVILNVPLNIGENEQSILIYPQGKKQNSRSEVITILNLTNIPVFETNDRERFEDYNYPHSLTELMANWVKECWWKAGGWDYPTPTTIEHIEPGYFGPELLTRAKAA